MKYVDDLADDNGLISNASEKNPFSRLYVYLFCCIKETGIYSCKLKLFLR